MPDARIPNTHEVTAMAIANWQPARKKPSTVYLKKMDVDFEVETVQGWVPGRAGDYVAHDPVMGESWPVSAEYASQHYEFTTSDPSLGTVSA
jgi:hypothetical protein